MNKTIYLDNNATSKIDGEVLRVIEPFLKEEYGNPSSTYAFGNKEKEAIKKARHYVASLIGADDDEIVFTSGSSESNVTAIMSAARSNPTKRHIISTKMEHASIMETFAYLESIGYEISYLDVDKNGRFNPGDLERKIKKETFLIVMMLANNETGNIYPVAECAKIAHKHRILFHSDAVQALGKTDIDVNALSIDTLSLSAHKIHGPKGIGALYIKRQAPFVPLIFGHQEKNRRGGTENVPFIVGFGHASKMLLEEDPLIRERIRELRDRLEKTLMANVENTIIYGDIDNRLYNTSNIAFKGVKGDELMILLESFGVLVSTGSACNSEIALPSHVLLAMDSDLENYSPIRISLSKYTTSDEIDTAIKIITNCVTTLRKNGKGK